jgi:succinate-semialdehyde dehydrogenase/glutarate-semialdehyde dehydrogenase
VLNSPLISAPRSYINGQWTGAESGATFPVRNPATGEHLADVPNLATAQTVTAIAAAEAAWRREPPATQRAAWLTAMAESLTRHRGEMARIITLEQGKPLAESAAEVDYAAGFFRFFAAQLPQLEPRSFPEHIRGLHWRTRFRPAGVVALITPWNFPLAMLAKKLAPALAAGCGIIAKPSELTPLTAIALWGLLDQLDLPPGLANLVTGEPAPIAAALCAHPAVRVISFTGSGEVGRTLLAASAAHVKRLALELGGNAPYLVFDDADIDIAADSLMANKFRCAGQTCVCANRVLVQRAIAGTFVDALAGRVRRLKVGNGLDPATNIGPLINRAAMQKVLRHVNDALQNGAHRPVGGEVGPPPSEGHDWGAFFPPTILTNTTPEMLLSREETFGPILALGSFDTEDQAVALANSTPYGLAAYLFTAKIERAQRVARALDFGHIGINTGSGPTPEMPFGGMKQSGFGREGGIEGLLEFIEVQAVVSA